MEHPVTGVLFSKLSRQAAAVRRMGYCAFPSTLFSYQIMRTQKNSGSVINTKVGLYCWTNQLLQQCKTFIQLPELNLTQCVIKSVKKIIFIFGGYLKNRPVDVVIISKNGT